MGLEAGTYISQLDPGNPLAGDRKNQGDDHLRLLKSVLKNTLPEADRPIRREKPLFKSGNYTLVEADDCKTIMCDTTVQFILTLPTPSYDGWFVHVIKYTSDGNPVFVESPSGIINDVARIRVNVPYARQTFVWASGGFIRMDAPGVTRAGFIEQWSGPGLPIGYGLGNGQSLIRTEFPELFLAWSTTFGAADGTHFNAPNLLDRFPVFAGNTYGLAATGGEATHTLLATEMPVHTHAPNLTQNPHDHAIVSGVTGSAAAGNPSGGSNSPFGPGGVPDVQPANADISITIGNAGGGLAHENRPPYFGIYPVFRLC